MTGSVAVWILASHILCVSAAWHDADPDPAQLQNSEFSKAFAQVQDLFTLVSDDYGEKELQKEPTSNGKKKKKLTWPAVEWSDSDFIIVDPFSEKDYNKHPARKKKPKGLPSKPTTTTKETVIAAELDYRPIGNVAHGSSDRKSEVEYLSGLKGLKGLKGLSDKRPPAAAAATPCSQKAEVKLAPHVDMGELKGSGTQDYFTRPQETVEDDDDNDDDDDEAQNATAGGGPDSENEEAEEQEDQEDDQEPAAEPEEQEEDEDESEEQQEEPQQENVDDGDDDAEDEQGEKGAPVKKTSLKTQSFDKTDQPQEGTETENNNDPRFEGQTLRSPSDAGFALQRKVRLHVKEAQHRLEHAEQHEEDGGDGEPADRKEEQSQENTDDESPSGKMSSEGPKVREDIEDTDDDTPQEPVVPTVFGINRNYQRLGVRSPYVPVHIGAESGQQMLLYKLVKVPKDVQEANRGRLKRVKAKGEPRSMRVISVKEVDPASMTLDVQNRPSTKKKALASEPVTAVRVIAPDAMRKAASTKADRRGLVVPCEGGSMLMDAIRDGAVQASEHGHVRYPNYSSKKKNKSGGRSRDHHDYSDSGDDLSENAESRYKEKQGKSHAHHDEGEHASGHKNVASSGSKHEDHSHDEGGGVAKHGHHTHSGGHEGDHNDYAEKGQDLSEHAKSKYKENKGKKQSYHDEGQKSKGKHRAVKGKSGHEDHGYDSHKMKKNAKGFRDKYNYDKTKKHNSFYSNHKKKGAWNTFDFADTFSFDDDEGDEKEKYKKAGSKKSGKGSKGFWQDIFSDDDEDEWKASAGYDKKYGDGNAYEDGGSEEKKRKYKYKPGFYSWG